MHCADVPAALYPVPGSLKDPLRMNRRVCVGLICFTCVSIRVSAYSIGCVLVSALVGRW